MWKNIVEPGTPQMTVWRTSIACCITKATNTHSEYSIIFAFPPQLWLQERASTLRYTCIAYLVTHDLDGRPHQRANDTVHVFPNYSVTHVRIFSPLHCASRRVT